MTEYKNMLATVTEQFKTDVPLFWEGRSLSAYFRHLSAALDAKMDSCLLHENRMCSLSIKCAVFVVIFFSFLETKTEKFPGIILVVKCQTYF